MLFFLVASVFLLASQTGMFISPVYRLTFSSWSFFGTLTVLTYILLVATFAMAVVCRTLFGRGLAHFLHVQDALEECSFTPVYFERGDPEQGVKTAPRDETDVAWMTQRRNADAPDHYADVVVITLRPNPDTPAAPAAAADPKPPPPVLL